MPDLLPAILLGLLQGLTEFLPVSSTAHLVLAPWMFGWESPLLNSLTFDVALHMGTLLAVLAYFARDWLRLAGGFLWSIANRSVADSWARLSWLVIVGTIPAVVVGVVLERFVESTFRSPLQIALVLALFSLVMAVAEWISRPERDVASLGPFAAFLVGVGQAIAIVPGVSRSGATISTGLLLGLKRSDAARFSFLLSTPIIAGAGVKRLIDVRHVTLAPGEPMLMVVGAAVAAVSGFICIHWLLAFLARDRLYPFVWYRLVLAVVVVAMVFARG